jgi:hypothetical protein
MPAKKETRTAERGGGLNVKRSNHKKIHFLVYALNALRLVFHYKWTVLVISIENGIPPSQTVSSINAFIGCPSFHNAVLAPLIPCTYVRLERAAQIENKLIAGYCKCLLFRVVLDVVNRHFCQVDKYLGEVLLWTYSLCGCLKELSKNDLDPPPPLCNNFSQLGLTMYLHFPVAFWSCFCTYSMETKR